jgi:Txe/YoeB family toxin of Txe-Axe toxin-antitoxin module
MSKHVDFQERGWNEYLYWQTQDKKTLKKINELRNYHEITYLFDQLFDILVIESMGVCQWIKN